MRIKHWPVFALIGICIVLIFANSLTPARESYALSGAFAKALLSKFSADPLSANLILRKIAHFLEYAALGAVMRVALNTSIAQKHQRTAGLAIALIVPLVDEALQRTVPGRSSSLFDVAIDVCGCAVGSMICAMIIQHKRHKEGESI